MNRALDVVVAGAGLALTSPLIGLAAIAIKLEDGGPVLYRQARVGKEGEDFELFKLRTMVVGAEKLGAGFAIDRGDPRITRVGRLLRRTSIDELPQLWNVVRGEMSVIGPRPTLALPGRALHGTPAAAARRSGRALPAGRRSMAARRSPGTSGSSSTSGTSSIARLAST